MTQIEARSRVHSSARFLYPTSSTLSRALVCLMDLFVAHGIKAARPELRHREELGHLVNDGQVDFIQEVH